MTLTIKTDNQWRDLVYRADVPATVLASDFDYQDADETLDGFFEYRGNWYHTDMFMTLVGPSSPGFAEDLAGWHGYHSDSAFSGVLVKLSSDGEQVMCATYFS